MARIVWDNAEVYKLLQSPIGAVGLDLAKRARRVKNAAQRQVGKKTGALKLSISIDQRVTSYGQKASVGSKLPYALLHHEGSRPHVILPVTKKHLAFVSKGRLIITNRVNHPGTRPNRYLTDNLPLAL